MKMINIDKDTRDNIDAFIKKYLIKYFSIEAGKVEDLIINHYTREEKVFRKLKTDHSDFLDLVFNHDHPFQVAARIFFKESKEQQEDFDVWFRQFDTDEFNEKIAADYLEWKEQFRAD